MWTTTLPQIEMHLRIVRSDSVHREMGIKYFPLSILKKEKRIRIYVQVIGTTHPYCQHRADPYLVLCIDGLADFVWATARLPRRVAGHRHRVL